MSIFSLFTQFVLLIEIAVYFGSLINPAWLPASQRRAMVKQLRDISKIKEAQFAFWAALAIIGLLFVESIVSLYGIYGETGRFLHDHHTPDRDLYFYQVKVLIAEKHLVSSGFALMMAIVDFMRLREKNNYIKLLEKYENKPEGEEVPAAEKKEN